MIEKEPTILKVRTFYSSVCPTLEVHTEWEASILAWADAHPNAYPIVQRTKSRPFGKGSCEYIGWAQKSDSIQAIVERLKRLQEESEKDDPFWGWRARFTLKHYKDKGFRGGFFQQFDGTYHRGCCSLDYTPGTLQEVIDRFRAWCENGPCKFPTQSIQIDKKVVWTSK
jgi:hypothetical protein